MTKQRVEGHQHLFKDEETGVITSCDVSERQRYRNAKFQAIDSLQTKNELSQLKSEMEEIKDILRALVNK